MIIVLLGGAAALAVLLWWVPRPTAWTPAGARPVGRGGGAGAAGSAEDVPVDVVPEALELLALALLGGTSLAGATAAVAAVLPGEHGEQLGRVGRALGAGADTSAAWAEAGPAWEPARNALDLAAVAGVPPGAALRQAATDLRRDAVADVEVATARLGVRLVLPLGLAFLPAFVLTTVLPLVLALTRELVW